MEECDDGGGGNICDEAEGEGAVGGNIVGIDGGGIDSFRFVKICKILGSIGAGVDFLRVDLVEHFDKGSIFRLYSTTNR